jgi:hypothetical protein
MYVNCTGQHTYGKPGATANAADQQWLDMQQAEALRQYLLLYQP